MNPASGARDGTPREDDSPGVRGDVLLWLIILASVGIRALAAASVPLYHDEAYYWLWSRHLALSYLDHPPLVAYLIFLGTRLGDGEIWVRLPALLLGAATIYVLFVFTRDLFGGKTAYLAVLLYHVVPILWLGGLVMVPDSPLQLVWILTLRLVWQAVHGRPQRWTWAGLVLGLGLLSKVQAALLGAGLLLVLSFRARPWLRRVEPYRAALLALLLFLPVVYWNVTHNWAAVRFILFDRPEIPRGMEGYGWFFGPQFALTLLLFPAFVWALWMTWRRRTDERFGYIFWTSLPAVVLALLAAPTGAARSHWLAPVYLALAAALGAVWNRTVGWLTGGNALLTVAAAVMLVVPALAPPPSAGFLYGFDQAAARIQEAASSLGEETVIVTDRYEIAAELAYYTRETVPVLLVPSIAWSVWPDPERFRGATALAATFLHSRFEWTRCAERVGPQPPVTTALRDQPMVTLRLFRLHNLSPQCDRRRP